jgi:hypothetical protein
MPVFNPNHVFSGAGTLYAAPIGTTEPTTVTGAWPAGWVALGYTDQGSELDLKPTTQAVTVEEEYWPIRNVLVTYEGTLTAALSEYTQQNILFALNAGIGTGQVSGTSGVESDGSIWTEMPAIGSEVRVMLGWDALPEGATQGQYGIFRAIVRQALQTGTVKTIRRKGSVKATIAIQFMLEKPLGVNPFRYIQPASWVS